MNSVELIRKSPIEKIEDAIVEFLKSGGLSSKYLISKFPDKPDEFDLGQADKAILVQYTGSRYGAPDAMRGSQSRKPEFALHIYLRSMGAPVRAPYEIDKIRTCVQSKSVEGASLYITRDGLIDQTGSLWRYLVEIAATPILAVPVIAQHPSPMITDFNQKGA